jgi:hypothetical protein
MKAMFTDKHSRPSPLPPSPFQGEGEFVKVCRLPNPAGMVIIVPDANLEY